ncbi:hypothetical protein Ruko_22410 [Ruthenibacterium sp. TH_2024_36131]
MDFLQSGAQAAGQRDKRIFFEHKKTSFMRLLPHKGGKKAQGLPVPVCSSGMRSLHRKRCFSSVPQLPVGTALNAQASTLRSALL